MPLMNRRIGDLLLFASLAALAYMLITGWNFWLMFTLCLLNCAWALCDFQRLRARESTARR